MLIYKKEEHTVGDQCGQLPSLLSQFRNGHDQWKKTLSNEDHVSRGLVTRTVVSLLDSGIRVTPNSMSKPVDRRCASKLNMLNTSLLLQQDESR